jgi:NAD(P)-dependent dehydrogenase (short-subunit alcohol dehydrogenase family)
VQNWTDTFTTNVAAQFFMSSKHLARLLQMYTLTLTISIVAFLPLLAKGGEATPGYSSSVVNVSSISGAMKGSSMGQFSYASSKAASTHLSRMLATTFKDVKVRVNVIAPGVFPRFVASTSLLFRHALTMLAAR